MIPELSANDRSGPTPSAPSQEAKPKKSRLQSGGLLTLAALILIVIFIWLFGGGSTDGPDAVAVNTAPTVLVTEPAPTVPDSQAATSAPAAPVASAAPNECETAALRQHNLTFSSPDVGESIPDTFTQGEAYALGFPTPIFEWSGVPAEATEIAILVQRITNDRDRSLVTTTDLWHDEVPTGQTRWIVTGIDPQTTVLPSSNLAVPLPEGVIEQDHNSPIVTIDDVPYGNKFVGPNSTARDFLFTVFALCDPATGERDVYSAPWLHRHAISIAWFASSLG